MLAGFKVRTFGRYLLEGLVLFGDVRLLLADFRQVLGDSDGVKGSFKLIELLAQSRNTGLHFSKFEALAGLSQQALIIWG